MMGRRWWRWWERGKRSYLHSPGKKKKTRRKIKTSWTVETWVIVWIIQTRSHHDWFAHYSFKINRLRWGLEIEMLIFLLVAAPPNLRLYRINGNIAAGCQCSLDPLNDLQQTELPWFWKIRQSKPLVVRTVTQMPNTNTEESDICHAQ